MDRLREFMGLRERLNHDYISKLLMMLDKDPATIKGVFENPKMWFNIKLRIRMLFDVGTDLFGLKSPEVFEGLQCKIEELIVCIDKDISTIDEDVQCTADILDNCRKLSDTLSSMAHYSYLADYDKVPSNQLKQEDYVLKIKELFKRIFEGVLSAMEIDDDHKNELGGIGLKFWQERCNLEKVVLECLVRTDKQPQIPDRKLSEALFILNIIDRFAEEVMSKDANYHERKTEAERLFEDNNVKSSQDLFLKTEEKLLALLEGNA